MLEAIALDIEIFGATLPRILAYVLCEHLAPARNKLRHARFLASVVLIAALCLAAQTARRPISTPQLPTAGFWSAISSKSPTPTSSSFCRNRGKNSLAAEPELSNPDGPERQSPGQIFSEFLSRI